MHVILLSVLVVECVCIVVVVVLVESMHKMQLTVVFFPAFSQLEITNLLENGCQAGSN